MGRVAGSVAAEPSQMAEPGPVPGWDCFGGLAFDEAERKVLHWGIFCEDRLKASPIRGPGEGLGSGSWRGK